MKRFEDPTYTYDEYVQIQISRSNKKWPMQSFDAGNLERMIAHSMEVAPALAETITVACMGCRFGNEYTVFKHLGFFHHKLAVYGIDINSKVEALGDNCFAYDFNKLPFEWDNKFDLLYSNSLDHAFNVNETIKEWRRVVKPDKFLLLDLIDTKLPDKSDVYGFSDKDIPILFNEGFEVIDVWTEPKQIELRCSVLVRVKK